MAPVNRFPSNSSTLQTSQNMTAFRTQTPCQRLCLGPRSLTAEERGWKGQSRSRHQRPPEGLCSTRSHDERHVPPSCTHLAMHGAATAHLADELRSNGIVPFKRLFESRSTLRVHHATFSGTVRRDNWGDMAIIHISGWQLTAVRLTAPSSPGWCPQADCSAAEVPWGDRHRQHCCSHRHTSHVGTH
jgi:hypothetical protein